MIKNSQKLTHYQKNRDATLQKSREYYENNKKKKGKSTKKMDFITWQMKKGIR